MNLISFFLQKFAPFSIVRNSGMVNRRVTNEIPIFSVTYQAPIGYYLLLAFDFVSYCRTKDQNNQVLQYWVTRSFACSALLVLLARSAVLTRSNARSLTSLILSLMRKWLIRWLFCLFFFCSGPSCVGLSVAFWVRRKPAPFANKHLPMHYGPEQRKHKEKSCLIIQLLVRFIGYMSVSLNYISTDAYQCQSEEVHFGGGNTFIETFRM